MKRTAWPVPRNRRDLEDGVLVQTALDDDVDLHRQARAGGRVDPGQNARDREVDVVHRPEDLVVQGVETHSDAAQARLRERLGLGREDGSVRRERDVEVAERGQPADQNLEVAAEERLAPVIRSLCTPSATNTDAARSISSKVSSSRRGRKRWSRPNTSFGMQ